MPRRLTFLHRPTRATRPARLRSVLPGFGLTTGYAVTYLSLIVLIPLATLLVRSGTIGWARFKAVMTDDLVLAAFKLSFGGALAAACVSTAAGLLIACVLVRYRFPGRRFFDAIVDLPFALPTAVAGIALSTLYADDGWVGQFLSPLGIHVAYTRLGVTLALVFIGLPFVVRTVQPVLQDLSSEYEEAARSLGASNTQSFWRVVFPEVRPALLTGFALAFARGLGEYGSVTFISANLPGKTQIVPQLLIEKLGQYDYPGATAIAAVMLVASFVLLLAINLLQRRIARRSGMG